jgi:hypothetical protein
MRPLNARRPLQELGGFGADHDQRRRVLTRSGEKCSVLTGIMKLPCLANDESMSRWEEHRIDDTSSRSAELWRRDVLP